MSNSYSLLPTAPNGTSNSTRLPKWVPSLRPRQFLTILSTLALFLTFISLFYWGDFELFAHPEISQWASNASNFDEIFLREALLPQHDLSAQYPEGRDGRFVRFSNQVWGLGWNNLLQERLMNTILAYESNRAPVFSPFEAWAHPPRDDSTPTGGRQVLVVPYNALLSGPTAGASWGAGNRHPRAISQKWWETVCPLARRKVLNADDIMKEIGKDSDGLKMLEEWANLLRGIPDSCVEIVGTQVFDFYLLGSTRILSLWNKFSKHPTVQQLGDSNVVTAALSQNMHKLQSRTGLSWMPFIGKQTGVISGLMAVHIRRGDYLGDEGKDNGHCLHLSKWGSTFTGWNQLTQLSNPFNPPPREGVEWGQNTPEVAHYYLKRCLPTPAQVTAHLHALRAKQRTHLSHVFIATNAEPSYLAELRVVLAADGWDPKGIVTSSELELNWQATSAGVAVDMAIMSRAEVFVGNGFSSLSSNVVMKRLTSGRSADTTSLW
ncbi:hypothetical protein BDV93DRAFT_486502 [Ceratobasidium sp. AG-I]|nr:hypothetical protein BDV93DRAFT_486502 [Ceratobasidium sp. AG-I]